MIGHVERRGRLPALDEDKEQVLTTDGDTSVRLKRLLSRMSRTCLLYEIVSLLNGKWPDTRVYIQASRTLLSSHSCLGSDLRIECSLQEVSYETHVMMNA